MPSSSNANTPWLVVPRPNPKAELRLFCFPYAGSGAVVYRAWPHDLPAEIEMCAAQLPGRENRFRETPLHDLAQVVSGLAQAMTPFLDKPFAFFGHSLGGLIGFELAHCLREQRGVAPSQLFISARRAPHIPEPLSPIHALPNEAFLAQVQERYGGVPQAILQAPDLLHAMLPMLRADFALFENYVYRPRPVLACPITVFGGEQDRIVNRSDLGAWREHTSGRFALHMLEGDHFFLRNAQTFLVREISRQMLRTLEVEPVEPET
jgi:medium-chain acyl-[acyl-carrier-protein] hydrolase